MNHLFYRIGLLILCLTLMVGLILVTACKSDTSLWDDKSSESSSTHGVPLRVSEPVDLVVEDLRSYIRERMNEANVPGLAIALIRNNEIVWTEGFGVTNRWTGDPVTPNTVFEVASISKVVTAYTALRLVEEGKLSINEPVHNSLDNPWLPPSVFADRITLRHLLSHSSGLGDGTWFKNKSIAFEPGTKFLYSGLGFEYVRELIEQLSDTSLEQVAREKVFEPLNMSSSSFVDETSVMNYMSNGHMSYLLIFLFFLIPFLSIMVIVGVITLILNRFIKRRWKVAWQLKISVTVLVSIFTELLLYFIIGEPFPNLIWMTVVFALIFFALLFLSFLIIRRVISPITVLQKNKILETTIAIFWMIFTLIVFIVITNSITGPVLKNNSSEASAIGSLRSTAPDLAAFLIELANPRYLSKDMASQIDTAQMNISQDFSWGLGIGIQHTVYGDAVWQNANTFAFRGIMVMYLQEGLGVVVLANDQAGTPVVNDIAERALGGEAKWKSF